MLSILNNKEQIQQTVASCEKQLQQLMGQQVRVYYNINPKINIDTLIRHIEEAFEIKWEIITSDNRSLMPKLARQVFAWLASRVCKITHADIGLLLNRQRTSITHSLSHVRDMFDSHDELYMHTIKSIEEKLMLYESPKS